MKPILIRTTPPTAGLLLALAATLIPALAQPDPIVEAARTLARDDHEAIVTVRALVNVEIIIGGSANQSQEQSLEVPGTVIAASGLTVLSNATIDVGKQIEQQITRQVRGREVDVKTTFKEVFILLRDGTEIPGQVILKDGDLDLAFVLPDAQEVEAEGVEFRFITFPEETPEVQLLDPVIILQRLGKDLDREISVYVTKVEALVKKPRRFILTHNTSISTPAFLPGGPPLGLFVRRIVNDNASSTVVLPAQEVTRLAREAAATPAPVLQPAETAEDEDDLPAADPPAPETPSESDRPEA